MEFMFCSKGKEKEKEREINAEMGVYFGCIYIIYRSGQKRAVKWYGDGEGQWCEMVQLMRTNTCRL
jgi:hypothetical protein